MNTLWGWGRASWAGCGPDVRRGGQTLIMGYSADKSPLISHLAGPLRRLEPLGAQRQEKCGPNRPTPTGYSCNNAPLHVGVRAYRRWRSLQELVVESLVVSLTMVVLDVLVDDEAQMPLAERDDTMEALLFDRPDEPLGIGVEIRAFRRQPDWLNIATHQDLAKDPRVEGIAVMNQLARGPQEAIDWIGQIAGHLFHPLAVGLRVDPGDVHPAGLQLDHEEDEIPPKTGQGEHLDREEIGGRQAFPVRLQERLPRRALVPLGSRGEPVVVQDPLDRVPGDVVAEVGERAADPRVAPRRILPRHPYDEFGHRPGRHRPSPTPAGTAIVLLGDQPPVPAENRVRRDDACHLTQDPPAEFLASHRESPALGVGQAKRSRTKMLPEDAILLPEIVDAIFLVASYPASQGQHEEVQSVGHGRRLHGSDTAVTHVVSGIHSPRPFSCTIRRHRL